MILVDFNHLCIAALLADNKGGLAKPMDMDLFRHVFLNTLRSHVLRFKANYGEVVLCCDGRNSWRKDVFKEYKAHRAKDRDKSAINWGLIFQKINTIKTELIKYGPYKVVELVGAEADDVIAVLVREHPTDKHLILSPDKDFVQLQEYDVKQFAPITKKYVTAEDPKEQLLDLIIHGDKSDGVPNALSAGDTFVSGGRQKQMTKSRRNELLDALKNPIIYESLDEDTKRYLTRNKEMICFDYIPSDISAGILKAYSNAEAKPKSLFMTYMAKNNMKRMIGSLGDF